MRKGADALRRENNKLRQAMRAAGYGNDVEKRQLLHEALQGFEEMNFAELVDFIKQLLD